jgi:hypothetical protein
MQLTPQFPNRRVYCPTAQPPRRAFRWFTWPLIFFLVLIPAAIVLRARREDMVALFVAYLNVLFIGATMIYLVTRRTYEAMIPFVFLIWSMFCFSATSIYFGLSQPDGGYGTTSGAVRLFMEGNLRVQLVTLLFLAGYIGTIIVLLPRRSASAPGYDWENPATRRMAYVGAVLSFIAYGGLLIAQGVGNESSVGYLLNGGYQYFAVAPVILGVMYPRMPLAMRNLLFAFFGITSMFHLWQGAGRGFAVLPWATAAFGLLFLSNWPARRKMIVLLVIAVVFPLVIMVGEATRSFRRKPGATAAERWETLTGWNEMFTKGSSLDQTMGRLFCTGGHALITLTPQDIPYMDFDLARYLREYAVSVFVPGRLYSDPYYSSNYLLNAYGLRVNQSTSVELTIPGSLWILGGWIPVLLGSIWIGLLHAAVMCWIRAATRKSPYQGLFYLTLLMTALIGGFTTELMAMTTTIFRRALAAIVLWHLLIRPILGRYARSGMDRQVVPSLQRAIPRFQATPAWQHR